MYFDLFQHPKVRPTVFINLLWLSIAVDSISPINHGEYNSKNGNNCCHDKFCHVENSFSFIGLDLLLVFRHLPLESMVVDNIIFFIEQLNNCEENHLPSSVQTFLANPQFIMPSLKTLNFLHFTFKVCFLNERNKLRKDEPNVHHSNIGSSRQFPHHAKW